MTFFAGYGLQVGPTNGQQMKGVGMIPVFSLWTLARLPHKYSSNNMVFVLHNQGEKELKAISNEMMN